MGEQPTLLGQGLSFLPPLARRWETMCLWLNTTWETWDWGDQPLPREHSSQSCPRVSSGLLPQESTVSTSRGGWRVWDTGERPPVHSVRCENVVEGLQNGCRLAAYTQSHGQKLGGKVPFLLHPPIILPFFLPDPRASWFCRGGKALCSAPTPCASVHPSIRPSVHPGGGLTAQMGGTPRAEDFLVPKSFSKRLLATAVLFL